MSLPRRILQGGHHQPLAKRTLLNFDSILNRSDTDLNASVFGLEADGWVRSEMGDGEGRWVRKERTRSASMLAALTAAGGQAAAPMMLKAAAASISAERTGDMMDPKEKNDLINFGLDKSEVSKAVGLFSFVFSGVVFMEHHRDVDYF